METVTEGDNPMATWTTDELDEISITDELNLQTERGDGTLRDPVTTWVVRHDDDLFVRAIKGRNGWYRGTRTRHEGHIRSGGIDKDVTFLDADADAGLNDVIDTEYQAKYSGYPADIVGRVINAQARSATIKLVPR